MNTCVTNVFFLVGSLFPVFLSFHTSLLHIFFFFSSLAHGLISIDSFGVCVFFLLVFFFLFLISYIHSSRSSIITPFRLVNHAFSSFNFVSFPSKNEKTRPKISRLIVVDSSMNPLLLCVDVCGVRGYLVPHGWLLTWLFKDFLEPKIMG